MAPLRDPTSLRPSLGSEMRRLLIYVEQQRPPEPTVDAATQIRDALMWSTQCLVAAQAEATY
jgi:hypothetical protein